MKIVSQHNNLLKQAVMQAKSQPKCYGIAKNYFTKALKADPSKVVLPTYPWIFAKPFTSLKPIGQDFMIPWHAAPDATVHEVELGVIMNGLRADQAAWQDRIGGYVLLLDMGDFDMIKSAITNKHSWTISKMQDNFLILGDLIPREAIEDPHNVDLVLKINSKIIQQDNTGNMIFKIPQQIKYLEEDAGITLAAGDLIMTGTPENIAPVREGDCLEATMSINGVEISKIVERQIRRELKPSHLD